jgi:DNA-binding transcriptional LysR family regulator
LVLVEGTSEAVADWVETGRVELGIVQNPTTEGTFAERILMTERFVLVVPIGHALAGRREVDLKAFAAEPFVFFKGRARMSALTACRSAGFEPRLACESGELETVRALVAAGLGVALLPELAARRARAECALLRVRRPKVERQLSLISKRGHTASSAAAAFEELLRKAGRQ